MSENNTPVPDEPKENASPPEDHAKPVVPWPAWKTLVLIVIGLVAIGLVTNATVRFEAAQKPTSDVQKPPPTYTGTAPLSITSISTAYNSNNDFVLVFTPCSDATLNSSLESITVQAANQIRSTDGIYVGVFFLPQNDSLTYPTLTVRLFSTAASAFPYTFRANITSDAIYNQYLSLKFLRIG
jgi:hypothetical protein